MTWKVMIVDSMSSGKNKSVKSGDIFGSVVALKKRKCGRDEEVERKESV